MKKNILATLVLFPFISQAQYQYGYLQESFFGRQPSARAEAMGKAYAAIDGDLATLFYNPAGTATLQGLELNTSFASPYYTLDNAKYNYLGVGYKASDYLTVGFSRNLFNMGQKVFRTDSFGIPIGEQITPTNTTYSLNLSSEPIKSLLVGINTNYLIWKPNDLTGRSLYFDFGVIKKFELLEKDKVSHSANLGSSITNLTFAKNKLDFYGKAIYSNLPVITRIGGNYQLTFNNKWLFDTLSTLKVLVQGDYQLLLNSDYHSGYHTGLEIQLLEMLALRFGYYAENQYDYGRPDANVKEIKDFTYGLGMQLPLNKLTRIPLNVSLDYTSLPQVSYIKTRNDFDNFNSVTMRLNWVLK